MSYSSSFSPYGSSSSNFSVYTPSASLRGGAGGRTTSTYSSAVPSSYGSSHAAPSSFSSSRYGTSSLTQPSSSLYHPGPPTSSSTYGATSSSYGLQSVPDRTSVMSPGPSTSSYGFGMPPSSTGTQPGVASSANAFAKALSKATTQKIDEIRSKAAPERVRDKNSPEIDNLLQMYGKKKPQKDEGPPSVKDSWASQYLRNRKGSVKPAEDDAPAGGDRWHLNSDTAGE